MENSGFRSSREADLWFDVSLIVIGISMLPEIDQS